VRAKGVKISHETSITLTATDCAAVAPVASRPRANAVSSGFLQDEPPPTIGARALSGP
jgi:hypothetical protein